MECPFKMYLLHTVPLHVNHFLNLIDKIICLQAMLPDNSLTINKDNGNFILLYYHQDSCIAINKFWYFSVISSPIFLYSL